MSERQWTVTGHLKHRIYAPFTFILVAVSFQVTVLVNAQREGQIIGYKVGDMIGTLLSSGVGLEHFEHYLSANTNYSTEAIDGELLAQELVDSVQSKIGDAVKAVREITTYIASKYSSFSRKTNFTLCCKNGYPARYYDPVFNKTADKGKMCYTTPKYGRTDISSLPVEVTDIFRERATFEYGVHQLYFASNDGFLFLYPSFGMWGECDSYDPRYRPFFVNTINKFHKDMVLLVDFSEKSTLAKVGDLTIFQLVTEIFLVIVGSLTSKDRIWLVPVSEVKLQNDGLEQHSFDFLRTFVEVSDRLKQDIHQFLDLLKTGQSKNISALPKNISNAFSELAQNSETSQKETSIVYIAGVLPESANIITKAVQNHSSNSHIFALYQVGTSPDLKNHMTSIAQAYGDNTVMQTFERIDNLDIQLFHKFKQNANTIRVSPVYVDFITNKRTLTVSNPVYVEGTFLGVIAVDYFLAELLSEVQEKLSKDSYMFMFDREDSSIVYHPLLQESKDGLAVSFTSIHMLEDVPIMKNFSQGTKSFDLNRSVRYYPKGEPGYEGIAIKEVPSTCHCVNIDMENLHFEICIVVPNGAEVYQRTVLLSLSTYQPKFFYHRFDLSVQQQGEFCRSYYRHTHKDKTALKIAPKGFVYPGNYLYLEETEEMVRDYLKVLDQTYGDYMFVDGVIDDVYLTTGLDNLWNAGKFQLDAVRHCVWRFIGTERGVYRVQPTLILPKAYDPTARPWYLKAMSSDQKFMVSVPYLDAFGAGYIITISKVVFEGETTKPFGVMGIDITMQYMQYLLETTFMVDCKIPGHYCFMVDEAGFIISHDSWVNTDDQDDIPVAKTHIMKLEPLIARHMIENGYMITKSCQSIVQHKDFIHYQINIKDEVSFYKGNQLVYKAVQAPNTNVFVIQKATQAYQVKECQCTDSKCKLPLADCECPCWTWSEDPTYPFIPCPPSSPDDFALVEFAPDVTTSTSLSYKKFDFCISVKCGEQRSKDDCYEIAHCRWCTHRKSGKQLQEPFCGNFDDCWFGQYARNSLYPWVVEDGPSGVEMLVILSITGSAALSFLAVVFLLFYCRVQKKRRRDAETVTESPVKTNQVKPSTKEPLSTSHHHHESKSILVHTGAELKFLLNAQKKSSSSTLQDRTPMPYRKRKWQTMDDSYDEEQRSYGYSSELSSPDIYTARRDSSTVSHLSNLCSSNESGSVNSIPRSFKLKSGQQPYNKENVCSLQNPHDHSIHKNKKIRRHARRNFRRDVMAQSTSTDTNESEDLDEDSFIEARQSWYKDTSSFEENQPKVSRSKSWQNLYSSTDETQTSQSTKEDKTFHFWTT